MDTSEHKSKGRMKILMSACLLGHKVRYDGTFSKALIPGMGVTAALLAQSGVLVFDEEHIDEALAQWDLIMKSGLSMSLK